MSFVKKSMLGFCFIVITSTAQAQTPPPTWQEHWFEHVQLLKLVYQDTNVALYYDKDVDTNIVWTRKYISDMWKYVKKTYGPYGTDPRLYAVLHTNKYSGGHPSTYFDASHDNHNVIDCGPGPWTSADYDMLTHEAGHIVEGASKNVHNSAAFGLWGDSKWCEIFNFDVYVGLGMHADSLRWYNNCIKQTHDKPIANAYWFRDWFFPIWKNYGGSKVLNAYYELLALYFKSGSLNWGQFVHFWSGAAGQDLKPLFATAFGWTSDMESQLVAAQKAFPKVTYGGTTGLSRYNVLPKTGESMRLVSASAGSVCFDLYSVSVASPHMEVVDLTGKKVLVSGNNTVKAGWNRLHLKTGNIVPGLYVLSVQKQNGCAFRMRFMLMK